MMRALQSAKRWLPVVAALIAFSCGTRNENNDPAGETIHANGGDTVITGRPVMVVSGCFQRASNGDTARLELQVRDSSVTGTFVVRNREKDRNDGTLSGVLRDSTLVGVYTFRSEGFLSEREVRFRFSGNAWHEGTGLQAERGNRIVFSDPSAIRLTDLPPYTAVPCN
ncbi:MAG: hypothetical protein JWP27_1865 [Flaviaesturariibacter sp.]|nr:hypothetical protein [Flaviaesturariibacter sp.]